MLTDGLLDRDGGKVCPAAPSACQVPPQTPAGRGDVGVQTLPGADGPKRPPAGLRLLYCKRTTTRCISVSRRRTSRFI